MKVGDLLLVTGQAFFEKTTVKDRKKGIYYLENGIQIDRDFHPLNSKYKVEPFDDEKYSVLTAGRVLTRGIEKLSSLNKEGIKNPDLIKYAANKITRILEKLEKK